MNKSSLVTAERLRELFHYDPLTGNFTRLLSRRGNNARAGAIAGSLDKEGYRQISIDKRAYRAHRLAWFHVHGIWPIDEIDHLNGCRDDNRLVNLRESTHAQNMQNQRRASSNNKSSGILGVTWHKHVEKWQSQIWVNGESRYLGCFDSAELAHAAYLSAKRELHPACTI